MVEQQDNGAEQTFEYLMTYGGTKYKIDEETFDKFDRWDGRVLRVIVDRGDGRYVHVFVSAGVPLEIVAKPVKESDGRIMVA
ncbi:hypothetical protein ACVWW9_002637 [Agrococcus sp. UYP33]